MFASVIKSTPFTSRAADMALPNIARAEGNFFDDVSFISTLRALLIPRIPTSDYFKLHLNTSTFTERTYRSNNEYAVVDAMACHHSASCSLLINSVSGCDTDVQCNFHAIESVFANGTSYPGYRKAENVTEFFRKSFKVLCYVCPDSKNAVVFVENITLKKLHYLQAAIPKFLPWYFGTEYSEEEKKLLRSFLEKSSGPYIQAIAELSAKYDFEKEYIRTKLAGFEHVFERRELEKAVRKVQDLDGQIDSYYDAISSLMRERREIAVKRDGLELALNSTKDGESELMEFFLCNKSVVLENVNDNGDIEFSVKTYMDFYDEDIAERTINNNRARIYSECYTTYIPAEKMRTLLTAIFIDRSVKLRVCAAYKFRNLTVSAQSRHVFGSECKGYLPNPHINEYSCLGNYPVLINARLKENDYVGAISQCIASAKSLNFADGSVLTTFVEHLYGTDGERDMQEISCIELPDKRVVTPMEAIYWLESERKSDEEKETEE